MIEKTCQGIPCAEYCEDEKDTFSLYEMCAPLSELSAIEIALAQADLQIRAYDVVDRLDRIYYKDASAAVEVGAEAYLEYVIGPAYEAGHITHERKAWWLFEWRRGHLDLDSRVEAFVERLQTLTDELGRPARAGAAALRSLLGPSSVPDRVAQWIPSAPPLLDRQGEYYLAIDRASSPEYFRMALKRLERDYAQSIGLDRTAVHVMPVPIPGIDTSFADLLRQEHDIGNIVLGDDLVRVGATLALLCHSLARDIDPVGTDEAGTLLLKVVGTPVPFEGQ